LIIYFLKFFITFPNLDCQSSLEDKRCNAELRASNETRWAFYFDGSCHLGTNNTANAARIATMTKLSAVSPAEEFYE
jgi:hypothetical protein